MSSGPSTITHGSPQTDTLFAPFVVLDHCRVCRHPHITLDTHVCVCVCDAVRWRQRLARPRRGSRQPSIPAQCGTLETLGRTRRTQKPSRDCFTRCILLRDVNACRRDSVHFAQRSMNSCKNEANFSPSVSHGPMRTRKWEVADRNCMRFCLHTQNLTLGARAGLCLMPSPVWCGG